MNNSQQIQLNNERITALTEILKNKTAGGGGGSDMLQARVDAVNNARYLFYYYTGTDVDYIANLDLSNVTDCSYMFQNCSNLTKMPPLTLSSPTTTNHSSMFTNCSNIKDGSLEITNVGNVHIFTQFANGLGSSFKSDGSSNVEITINGSGQDVRPVFKYAFQNSGLKTVKIKNIIKLGSNDDRVSSMFSNCNIQTVDLGEVEYFSINNKSYSPFSSNSVINRLYAKALRQIGVYNIHYLGNAKMFLGDTCSLAGTTTNHITVTVKFFIPYLALSNYYSTATNWATLLVNDGNEETRMFVYGEFSSGDTLPITSGNYNITWYEDDDFTTPAGSIATANKEYYGKISAVV